VLPLFAHVTALQLQSTRCTLAPGRAWPGVRGLALHAQAGGPCSARSAVLALHGECLSAVLGVLQGARP